MKSKSPGQSWRLKHMETIRKQMFNQLDHHLDVYNAIMAGQASGDEHREMEEAEKIARILRVNILTYMDERHGRPEH